MSIRVTWPMILTLFSFLKLLFSWKSFDLKEYRSFFHLDWTYCWSCKVELINWNNGHFPASFYNSALTPYIFVLFLKYCCGQISHFSTNLTQHSQKSFPKLYCLFSTVRSSMSRNRCKLCHKLRDSRNIHPWSPNFWNYICLSNFTDN